LTAHFPRRKHGAALRNIGSPFPAHSATRSRIIIAACATGAVAAANDPTYLVGSIQEADDQVSLTLD
jgi:hypothetical protein